MATHADAEAGWEIFKHENYALTFDEINWRLQRQRYAPISHRTYQHYHKLVRYGFEAYIPINQLDVKTLRNPVWDAAVRNRYITRETDASVLLRMLQDHEIVELSGQALRISDGVVVIRLPSVDAVNLFSTGRRTDALAELVFQETGEIRMARTETVSIDRSELVTVRLSFLEVGSLADLVRKEALAPLALRVVVTPYEEDVYLANVVQGTYWLFQALEASRVLCEDILASLDTEDRFTFTPPRVKRLNVSSPLDALLQGAEPYILVVTLLLGRLISYRKTYHEGSVAKWEARRLRWDQLEKEHLSREDIRSLLVIVTERIRSNLQVQGQDAPTRLSKRDTRRMESIVDKQIIPSLEALINNSEDVELESDVQLPEWQKDAEKHREKES